ncbi:unnamed protein product, partial [Pylaiella littoralis]
MGPLQFAAQVAGVPQSNLHKWAGDEAVIVGKAAEKVTSGLLGKSAKRSWFPKAEQALYGLYMAKRRKGLKVSTLWLCTMMAQEVKKHYPDDPRRLIFKPSWRWAGSGQTSAASLSGDGATPRTRASSSASQDWTVSQETAGSNAVSAAGAACTSGAGTSCCRGQRGICCWGKWDSCCRRQRGRCC